VRRERGSLVGTVRIQLITHYFPPEIGAAPRRLGAFARHWSAAGHAVTVIAPLPHYPSGHLATGWHWRDLRRATVEDGVTVVRVPFVPTRRGGAVKLADHLAVALAAIGPATARRERPDVVVASIPSVPTLGTGLVASRRWRAPLVLDMRDSWPDLIEETGLLPGAPARWLTRLVAAGQRRAEVIVTVPPAFARSLERRGYPAERIFHIPNGIDVASVPLQPAPPKERSRLRVLYLGTIGVSQGLETVVGALADLGPERVEARFVGDGTEKPALEEASRRLGAPVSFGDPVTGQDLTDAYAWADTCLVPLRDWPSFNDAVPSKLYEIMAAGRYVTASLAGEGATVVRAAGGGTVVPPEDRAGLAEALGHLADHREELDVGAGPRTWVTEHADVGRLADRYLEVLERAVGGTA